MATEGIDGLLLTGEANVRYISGFSSGDSYALLTEKGQVFLTDSRYTEQAGRECAGFTVMDYRGNSSSLEETLAAVCRDLGIRRLGFERDIVTYDLYETLRGRLDQTALVPTRDIVESVRIIKDEEEIRIMKKAAAIATAALEDLLPLIKPGISELDIQRELEYLLLKGGAAGTSFPTIVASGPRGSLPHGAPSGRQVQPGDFITLDFGARYQGYCSDMTRTLVLGEPDTRQKEVYGVVQKAQAAGLSAVRAGVLGSEVDQAAREVIQQAGYGDYFGHGLGHGLGLEIHEQPFVNKRCEKLLQAGSVLTVEPGIYLPDWGGVRIEDSVLVTPAGCEIITHFSKELIIL